MVSRKTVLTDTTDESTTERHFFSHMQHGGLASLPIVQLAFFSFLSIFYEAQRRSPPKSLIGIRKRIIGMSQDGTKTAAVQDLRRSRREANCCLPRRRNSRDRRFVACPGATRSSHAQAISALQRSDISKARAVRKAACHRSAVRLARRQVGYFLTKR